MTLKCVGLPVFLAVVAAPAMAQTIEGTATFRERMTLPVRARIVLDDQLLFTGDVATPVRSRPRAQIPATTSSELIGTAWQLVKFQGSDDTTLTPDDKTKYTIAFEPAGRLHARIDCNRGRGTWKSSGANHLELGPLALTRAKCPEGSLHDRMVKQWRYVRSFLIKDGHLFLVLMADGGTYEFEPREPSKP